MAKCLSIRQSYAELVVSGRKTIELGKWNARFGGE
ncbi:MAG: ASCH domain-containing protein [Ignavibacteriales bacterium]